MFNRKIGDYFIPNPKQEDNYLPKICRMSKYIRLVNPSDEDMDKLTSTLTKNGVDFETYS